MYTKTKRGRLSNIPSVPLTEDDPWNPWYQGSGAPTDVVEATPEIDVTETIVAPVVEAPGFLAKLATPGGMGVAGAVLGYFTTRGAQKTKRAMMFGAAGAALGFFLNRS